MLGNLTCMTSTKLANKINRTLLKTFCLRKDIGNFFLFSMKIFTEINPKKRLQKEQRNEQIAFQYY